MYKLETHLHTRYSSICSELDETYLIPEYLKKGFLGLAITDHYNRTTFQMKGIDLSAPGDKLTPFLEGYYRMKEAGEKSIMSSREKILRRRCQQRRESLSACAGQ